MAPLATSRDREVTERRLIETVGRLVARSGFAALGGTRSREARVDKVLVHRCFDGLPNLLKAYCGRGDFWPTADEVLQPDVPTPRAAPLAARTAAPIAGKGAVPHVTFTEEASRTVARREFLQRAAALATVPRGRHGLHRDRW